MNGAELAGFPRSIDGSCGGFRRIRWGVGGAFQGLFFGRVARRGNIVLFFIARITFLVSGVRGGG